LFFVCAGCIDTGIGHDQLNKLLAAANLPVISRNTIKLAEERVGAAVVETANDSCKEAIALERQLSESARLVSTPFYYFKANCIIKIRPG